ncbi:MAG TPA: hypothetical protein VKM93_07210 [Terriglobia bacterium]|nr:hypothetical protein [Terriglobia bacterium]
MSGAPSTPFTNLRERRFLSASSKTFSQFKLRETAAGAGQPATPIRMVSVSSVRAPLVSAPDSSATTKMYLVKGGKVEIVDDSKFADGWLLVRYVTAKGKVIEKWVSAQDLKDVPQK